MSLNPYAPELGQRDPVEVMEATPARLEALLGKLSSEQIEKRPAPDKWSIREIIAHLADCELAFGFRLRQGAAGVDIQPFDQDDWARNYSAYSAAAAMATYRALRAWNVAFVRSLTQQQKTFEINHPERGTMPVWTIVETMAGHDLHHLERLEKQVSESAG
ncbi:MAG TPA: DinB family protein [Acidobacteriaceae bacterium]|nr:DinB family protein [Acidobacteriaceae bacterium]